MEPLSIDQITTMGKNSAKYSFLIGTALFLFYCVTKYNSLIPAGLIYIFLAFVWNSIILATVLIMIIIYPKDYLGLLRTAIIVLLNIPVAYLYFLILTDLPFQWL